MRNGDPIPDTRYNDEYVINFIRATTNMFIHGWYPTVLKVIKKFGFKTRLGMATVMRAVVWTGGDDGVLTDLNRLLIGAYGNKSKAAEYLPFGDENKEKEFVRLYWEGHANSGRNKRIYKRR